MLRRVSTFAMGVLLSFFAPLSSQADMRIKDYQEMRTGTEADQETADLYLTALLDGFRTANAALAFDKQKRLFCPPPAMVLQVSNARQLIDKALSESFKGVDDTTIVSNILLLSLKNVFPCSG